MNSICDLFDINDFKRFFIQKSTSFNVIHLKKKSVLGNKFDELCLELNGIKTNFSVRDFKIDTEASLNL